MIVNNCKLKYWLDCEQRTSVTSHNNDTFTNNEYAATNINTTNTTKLNINNNKTYHLLEFQTSEHTPKKKH